MQTLVFDISGDYAMFRKPYSAASPISYPVPPPSAVIGIVGAILGLDKAHYAEQIGWQQIQVGIAIRSPIERFRTGLNVLHTKNADKYFRPRAGESTHAPQPFEFLRNPSYRIYLSGLTNTHQQQLSEQLQQGRSHYNATLGLANCHADITWVGEWNAQPIEENSAWQCVTVVPLQDHTTIHYQNNRHYQRFRIPAAMDSDRIVHRYQEVLVAEDGRAIEGHGGAIYRVGEEQIAWI